MGQVRHRGDLLAGLLGEGIPQLGSGVHEGRTGKLQPHHFHQHLVGVGGAIEGAGARGMIGLHLGFQQFFPPHFTPGIALAHRRFLGIGQPGRHGAGRNEDHRQMPEAQGAGEQAGDDLVADAHAQGAVEDVVRQRYGRGLGDDVPGEKGEFHARLALGNPVAHGRHPGCELGDMPLARHSPANLVRIAAVGLVGGEDLVVAETMPMLAFCSVCRRIILSESGLDAVTWARLVQLMASRCGPCGASGPSGPGSGPGGWRCVRGFAG